MVKKEALEIAKDIMKLSPGTYKDDVPAKRELWSNLVDQLIADGHVSEARANTWFNPF